MGIDLAKHKQMSFIISSFFAAIGGALMAMFLGAVSSTTFTIAVTYFILLIVVIGGMGSVTGSVISAFSSSRAASGGCASWTKQRTSAISACPCSRPVSAWSCFP